MADFKIHNDFSDLDFLFDSESTDIVADITKKRFKENLLFAIIETVTISRVKGIGTTQYLSYKKVDFIEKTIHKDYLEIILREERNIQQAIESMEISEWNDQFAQLEGKSPTSTPKMYSGMINTGIANDSGKYPLEKTEESIPKPQKIEPIKNVAHVGLIKIQKSFISRTLIFTYSDSTSFKETVKISLFSSVQTKRQATKRILQLLMQAPRVLQVMTSSTLDKILQVAKVNGLNVQAQAVLANKRIISIID